MDVNPVDIPQVIIENGCILNYVQVFEGESMDGPSLGKWCDNKTPPSITSTGSSLTLHLFSHYEFVGYFAATYSSLNTGTLKEYICKRRYTYAKTSVILFPFLSLRRKLHVRARDNYLAELSKQLSSERGMRLDSEYVARQQAYSHVHRVRYRIE